MWHLLIFWGFDVIPIWDWHETMRCFSWTYSGCRAQRPSPHCMVFGRDVCTAVVNTFQFMHWSHPLGGAFTHSFKASSSRQARFSAPFLRLQSPSQRSSAPPPTPWGQNGGSEESTIKCLKDRSLASTRIRDWSSCILRPMHEAVFGLQPHQCVHSDHKTQRTKSILSSSLRLEQVQ